MSGDRTRSRNRTRDAGEPADPAETEGGGELGEVGSALDGTGQRRGIRERIANRASGLFSLEIFLAALSMTAGGLVAASTTVALPGAGLAGVFLATFLLATFLKGRHYLEATVAGAVVVGASVPTSFTAMAFLSGFGYWLVAVGAAVGGWVALVGSYFGRDLRDGLTREL